MSELDETRRDGPGDQLPPKDGLGKAIAEGASVDPIEMKMVMQRVRSKLAAPTHDDPVRIGRHVVVRPIASGGFGTVYEAYDPELERKLAVKVLRGGGAGGTSRRARGEHLLEEARALAKISHPNVVSVFDVGVLANPEGESQVYLAMEMVEGESLREWLNEARPWPEVVARFREAALGLAAAHEQGIVHRDFKPANVLVGHDGRVRVADFGLALAERSQGEDSGSGVSGTPRYMAPEQHRGEACDPRTDVYSFCVSLYEAVYGRAPFTGETLADLRQAKEREESQLDFSRAAAPRWLRDLIARGLEVDPAARWPDFPTLLAQLDHGLAAPRRRAMRLGGGLVLVAGLGLYLAGQGEAATGPCETQARERGESLWNETLAGRLATAFEATELDYAASAWNTTRERLETVSSSWVDARVDLCRASDFLRTHAPHLLESRARCLDARAREFESLTELMAEANPRIVQRSVHAAYGLADATRCAQDEAPEEAAKPLTPEALAASDEVREQMARLRSLRLLGQIDRLEESSLGLADAADALEDTQTKLDGLFENALVLETLGQHQDSIEALQMTARLAEREGHWTSAAQAKTRLVWMVGHVLARPKEGQVWAHNADAALAHLDARGDDTRTLRAHYLNNLAAVHFSTGDFDAAFETYQRSRELWTQIHGADHPTVMRALTNMGSVHFSRGELAEAAAAYREVIDYRKATLGESHPSVALTLANLGSVLQEQGDREGALRIAEEVLALRSKVMDPDHPHLARAHHQLAVVLGSIGQYERAEQEHLRALEIQRKTLGETHPDVAFSLNSLGSVAERLGDTQRAESLYREAIEHVMTHQGADHQNAALTWLNLGDLLRRQGKHLEARDAHERALAHYEGIDPDHPRTMLALSHLSLDLLELGDAERALELATRARAIAAKHKLDLSRRVEGEYAQGRARWQLGIDRAQARAQVESARNAWSKDPGAALEAAEARAWLAQHSG